VNWSESKCGDEVSKSGVKWSGEWREVKVLHGMCVLSLIYS
jgi:hypothetical protein